MSERVLAFFGIGFAFGVGFAIAKWEYRAWRKRRKS